MKNWRSYAQYDPQYIMSLSIDGLYLVAGSVEPMVRIWEVPSGTEVLCLPLETWTRALHLHGEDELWVAVDGHEINTLAVLKFQIHNLLPRKNITW